MWDRLATSGMKWILLGMVVIAVIAPIIRSQSKWQPDVGTVYRTWGPSNSVFMMNERRTGGGRTTMLKNEDQVKVLKRGGELTKVRLISDDYRDGEEGWINTKAFVIPESWR